MDNILKLLLGVLSISGMIALLVPSENPIAPPVESAPPQAAAPAPVAEEVFEDEDGADVESEGGDEELDGEESDEEDFGIGEPSIDGQPFGGEFNVPSDRPNAVVNTIDNTQQQPEPVPMPVTVPVPVTNSENVVL